MGLFSSLDPVYCCFFIHDTRILNESLIYVFLLHMNPYLYQLVCDLFIISFLQVYVSVLSGKWIINR